MYLGFGLAVRRRSGARRRTVRGWSIERLEGRALLSTITVSNTDDAGAGSLRAAIEQANQDAAQDTITFAPSVTGTISLSSALPDLSAGMNVIGPGPSALTVARNGANGTPGFGIFTVSAGAQVAISGLTVTGGLVGTVGGGIDNSGTLTVTDCTLSDNSADGLEVNSGGGIFNSGTLTVTDCTLSGNSADGSPFFGAGGSGGGICNSGTLTVTNSTLINNNSADGSGGGIANSDRLTVTNSTISDNSGSAGGGIDNSGTLTVFGSNISDNAADEYFGLRGSSPGSGGGIYNSGMMTVSGSTLSGNAAEGGGGDTFGLGAIGGSGGGIFNSGTLTVTNSTISANAANVSISGGGPDSTGGSGGGMFNSGALTVTNSTLSGNAANGGVTNGGSGGGIFDAGSLRITYATIADNSVSGNSSRTGSGIAISKGPDTEVQSIDSIFKNLQGGNISGGSAGTFRSLGHNLFSNRPRVRLLHSDLINPNPLIGPLANNGGPTMTMALLTGSPAIDAGVAVPGVATDQRGVARPQGSVPDIGAFESPNVQRFGIHDQPTTLVLNFGEPLDAARAENLANYILVRIRSAHRPGTTDDTVIPILSASYDIASETVTLQPTERLPINWTYRLTVVCTPPGGLTDTSGNYLDGEGMGQTGSDFVAIVSRKSLAGRDRT